MNDWLRNTWNQLTSSYSDDPSLIDRYWNEIESQYTSKNRHYHSLVHIFNMLKQAETYKDKFMDYDGVRFAIYYHDIIYQATNNNNEVKSAEFANKRLKSFNFDEKRTDVVEKLIISTKNHQLLLSENKDNSYFLDFDLAVLGTDWNSYQNYTQNIRKEYSIYPDFVYNKGRRKVLVHFLKRELLYFTDDYRNRFEKQARENLRKEIELL
ncbi:MAG: HD domain-containing protein [Aquaticitalea sp.]